jgi:hypothetical protein
MTYSNVVSVPVENTIHVLRKRPQENPMSPRRRCVVVISHTTDTHPVTVVRLTPQRDHKQLTPYMQGIKVKTEQLKLSKVDSPTWP